MELATPDLDLIKQAEQGARDRRGRFVKSRSGNPVRPAVRLRRPSLPLFPQRPRAHSL